MRYPQEKIKEAILHPDIEIRIRAVSYFAEAASPDPSVMPLVITAVEKFGRRNDAFRLIGNSRDLVQTEDTIAWVIDELNAEQPDKNGNYAFNLSMVLLGADPALLLPRESDILEAPYFLAGLREPLTDRLRMLSWDEATCWQRLESFCEEGKDQRYINDVNLSDAYLVIEALARYGDACEPRVHELLAAKVDDLSHHPMKWMEPLVIRLAGLVRLESTIPLIVGKLLEDGDDLVNEECSSALTQIGTPSVLHAIADAFPTAGRHSRLYASSPLERIQSDLAVEVILNLLELELEFETRCELANALLHQFAHEGIEIARNLLLGREFDFNLGDLRNHLLENCTLTGERFPEYDEWLATKRKEKEEHWRRMKELEGDPEGMLLFALEKLAAQKTPAQPLPQPPPKLPPASMSRLELPRPGTKQKVGRNDLCPCGSGKKFKVCCLRR